MEQLLLAYVQAAGLTEGPLFRSANRKTSSLTKNAMAGTDVCRMMKRRLKAADLPAQFSPLPFRVATVTDLLEQNVLLEDVQPKHPSVTVQGVRSVQGAPRGQIPSI
jgi:integrase/recombinase XerD